MSSVFVNTNGQGGEDVTLKGFSASLAITHQLDDLGQGTHSL